MTVITPHPVHPDFPQEESHLSGTIASVLYQIDAWEDRSRNVGADLETSLVLADEAEERQPCSACMCPSRTSVR
jgi:DNA helicase-2/ATP-dependent DNA helicase PcrA